MPLWSDKKSSESYFLKQKDGAERYLGTFGMVFGLIGFVIVVLLIAWLAGII